jgi:hypothetical protein
MQEEVSQELAGFNPLVVHKRDSKTGKNVGAEHFTMICHKGVRFYEWPKASKNLWFENRAFAGRLGEDGIPVKGEPHVAFKPKLTVDQTIGMHNQVLEKENERLMLELSEIKNEKEMEQKLAAPTPAKGKVAVSKK